jgi:CubicO group peptidase (beta-lactamase class C family)
MIAWKHVRLSLTLTLVALIAIAPFATFAGATTPSLTPPLALSRATATAPDQAEGLAAIEKAIDHQRQELGIPGASLVIVKDDKVIYMKGLGFKDFEQKLPVTPDTLFAIGSASKAFTSMAAMMSADEGKLSLEDSPKKLLPYFKLYDPDADAKITLRDLLSHRSGLNRTDLAMVTGALNREELIRVVGMAKPTVKLREKFQYQNIMYTAAGEAVARAQHATWDQVIADKIFKPLGMKATVTTDAAMQHSPDFSYGYEYSMSTKQTRRLPMREIPAAAPAGAINSNARDMAQWLRLMLGGGAIDGKRLVSEKSFNELLTKQINVAGNMDYGLGWFLQTWDGHLVAQHGGNIDGFNAQVGFMPDQKLGFVLLTNVTASSLVNFAMETVWANLVGHQPAPTTGGPTAGATVDPNTEIGQYKLVEAGVDVDISMKEGKLVMSVPGQSPYPLENIGGRRYRLTSPAPDGFFCTFRPVKGKETETEMYLEQPQGNAVLPKIMAATTSAASVAPAANGDYAGPLKEVLGSYENQQEKVVMEITLRDGKPTLVAPGDHTFPLEQKEKDKLRSTSLPNTYWIDVKRDAAGKVNGIVMNQPEGQFAFVRLLDAPASVSVDDLLPKIIAAHGGEENLRKHKSMVTTVAIDFENQGVTAEGTTSSQAPNATGSSLTLWALGKKIGAVASYFDGTGGGQTVSFAPEETFKGKRLADIAREADFYGPADWKKNFKTITFKRIAKVAGEDCYVLDMKPATGSQVTVFISAKSYLILRRDSVISSDTSGQDLPQSQTFSDYRMVGGMMLPFKTVDNDIANGNVVTIIKDVKFDVAIPESMFHKP